jgi:hypothetical protein
MTLPQPDLRSERRKLQDEQLANEPQLAAPDLDTEHHPAPVEELLRRRPLAVMGIVENGMVRLLDPEIRLPERSRVIVVTSERG